MIRRNRQFDDVFIAAIPVLDVDFGKKLHSVQFLKTRNAASGLGFWGIILGTQAARRVENALDKNARP